MVRTPNTSSSLVEAVLLTMTVARSTHTTPPEPERMWMPPPRPPQELFAAMVKAPRR
jgi:hypothetical protein